MPYRLLQLYQRKRIININLNVVAAGLLAIGCTKVIIWRVHLLLPHADSWVFTVTALVSDMVFDVLIYYVLHWCANHWRPFRKIGEPTAQKPPAFLKDATLVQFERALLSPIYYILAGALMHILQDMGWTPGWAMVAAFTSGLLATRVLHTGMGLYTGSFRDAAVAAVGPVATAGLVCSGCGRALEGHIASGEAVRCPGCGAVGRSGEAEDPPSPVSNPV